MRSEGWKSVYLAFIAMMTLAVEGQVIYISIGGPGVVRDCTTECKNTSHTCDFPTEPIYLSSSCQVTIMAGDYTARILEVGGNNTAVSITVTAQQNVAGLTYKSATRASMNGGAEMFVGDMAAHRLKGYWENATLSISTDGFVYIVTPRMTLNPEVVHLLRSEAVGIGDATLHSVISHASPSSLPFAFELMPASSSLTSLTFYEVDISLTHGFTQSTVRDFHMSYSSANVSSIFGGMRSLLPDIYLQYSTLYGLADGFGFTNASEVIPELVTVDTKNVTIDRSGQGSSSLSPLLPPGMVSGVLEITGHCLGCEFSLNITSRLYINGRCDSPIKIHFPNSGSPSVTLNGSFSRATTPKAGDPPMLALTATRQITFVLKSFETSVIYNTLRFVSGDLESSLGLCDMILSNITAPMSYLSVSTLCIGSRVAIGPHLNISKRLLNAGLPGPTNLTSVSSSTDSIWRLGPIEYDVNVHANASIEYWTSNTSSGIRNASSTVSFSLVLPQIHIVWNDTDTPKPSTPYALISSFRNLSGATISSNSPYEVRYDEISQSLFWTYTPISPVLPCPPTQPDPSFDCIDGEWQSFTPIDKATFSVPPASGRLVVQGSMRITDSLLFNGLGSSIAVNGCTSITGKVSLSLSETEYKRISETSKSGDSSRTVLVSQARGCTMGLDTITVAVSHSDNGCKKVKSRNSGDRDSLALLFQVDSSACNTKWIILGSVLGGVLVITVIVLSLVFTLNPKARAIVRPYADRSNRKPAVM